jgi:hypothetical protein
MYVAVLLVGLVGVMYLRIWKEMFAANLKVLSQNLSAETEEKQQTHQLT